MNELEKRAAAIESTLGLMGIMGDQNAPLIKFSQSATGMVSQVGNLIQPVNGLVSIVGSLEGLSIKKGEDE